MDEQDRVRDSGRWPRPALMSRTRWPRGRRNSRVVSQLRGPAIGAGNAQAGQPERLADQPAWIGRGRRADERRDARIGGRGQDRPDRAHRVAQDRPGRDLGPGQQGREGRPAASAPNSPALTGSVSAGLAPWPRTSKVRQWKPAALQELDVGRASGRGPNPSRGRGPPRARRAAAGRDEPGRAGRRRASGRRSSSNASPKSAGVNCGRPAMGKAGPDPVDLAEAIGEGQRHGGSGRQRRRRGEAWTRANGTPGESSCQAWPDRRPRPGRASSATARLGR